MRDIIENLVLLGAGFIASHIVPLMIPYVKRFIIVDRDYVFPENYDNCVYPRGALNRRKVLALGTLIQILSDKQVLMVHKDVKNVEDIEKILGGFQNFIGVVTFDNIASRRIAYEYAVKKNKDIIFVGTGLGYIYVQWAEKLYIPEETGKVIEEAQKVRDICSRLEFRTLGSLSALLTTMSILHYVMRNEKKGYICSIKNSSISIAEI